MDEELRDLADTIDEIEDELWRQWAIADDPQLEKWFMSNGRMMSRMKTELKQYIKGGRSYAQS